MQAGLSRRLCPIRTAWLAEEVVYGIQVEVVEAESRVVAAPAHGCAGLSVRGQGVGWDGIIPVVPLVTLVSASPDATATAVAVAVPVAVAVGAELTIVAVRHPPLDPQPGRRPGRPWLRAQADGYAAQSPRRPDGGWCCHAAAAAGAAADDVLGGGRFSCRGQSWSLSPDGNWHGGCAVDRGECVCHVEEDVGAVVQLGHDKVRGEVGGDGPQGRGAEDLARDGGAGWGVYIRAAAVAIIVVVIVIVVVSVADGQAQVGWKEGCVQKGGKGRRLRVAGRVRVPEAWRPRGLIWVGPQDGTQGVACGWACRRGRGGVERALSSSSVLVLVQLFWGRDGVVHAGGGGVVV